MTNQILSPVSKSYTANSPLSKKSSTIRSVTLPYHSLTKHKHNTIQYLINEYQKGTQSFIHSLYHSTNNLKLHNTLLKQQGIESNLHLTENAYTFNLNPKSNKIRTTRRYKDQMLCQALETLKSIDYKQSELAFVQKNNKRQAKQPKFKGFPQLHDHFITIQFKSDNPTLQQHYPVVINSDKQGLKQYQPTKNQSVQCYSYSQWHSIFGISHFDICVKLSHPTGQEPILLFFKSNKQFNKYLQLSTSDKQSILIPFAEIQRKGIRFSFEIIKSDTELKQLPLKKKDRKRYQLDYSIFNLSNKVCSYGSSHYFNPKSEKKYFKPNETVQLLSYIQELEDKEIVSMDLGRVKGGVYYQGAMAKIETEKMTIIGVDHNTWLIKLENAYDQYQLAINRYKKAPSRVNRITKERSRAEYHRIKTSYGLYLDRMIKELPWGEVKVLVVENLTNIKIGEEGKKDLGRRFNKRNAQWHLNKVFDGILKGILTHGVMLIMINPKNTSKECPVCHTVLGVNAPKNRIGERYTCRCCTGEVFDADMVGAYHIKRRMYQALC